MRSLLAAFACLSVIFLGSLEMRAQGCIPALKVAGVAVTGTGCDDTGGFPSRCEPGSVVTFQLHLASETPGVPATCPAQLTWNFGPGTSPVVTSSTTIQRTFDRIGHLYGSVTADVPGTPKTNEFGFDVASGYFGVQAPLNPVTEGHTANVTITRSGNVTGSVSLDYRTYETTRIQPSSGTVVFQAGETTKNLALAVIDDTAWNGAGPVTVTLRFDNPTGGYLMSNGEPETFETFRIADNDEPARHRCTATNLIFRETDGNLLFPMERTGNLANTTWGTVHIHFAPEWYLNIGDIYSVAFAPGQATATLAIPIADDHLYTGTSRTTFTCDGSGPGVITSPTQGEIAVRDDEPFPTLIAPAALEVTESDEAQLVEIPVDLVPPFGRYADIYISAEGRTADGNDFKLISSSFENPIVLEIDGDDLPESDERLVVLISGEISKTIPVIIQDDDRPPFPYAFSRDEYVHRENDVEVVIQRSGSLAAPADLMLHVRPASSIPWPVDPVAVHFAPSQDEIAVRIPSDDGLFTGDRSATLELELEGFIGATAFLTVQDDETIPSLSIGDAVVSEGNVDQTSRIDFPLTLSAPVGYEVQVTVSLAHVTTDAADFVSTPSQTVAIFPGDLIAKVSFDVRGDIDLEADETFAVSIAACCGPLATVGRATGTGTIQNDDDAPTENLHRLILPPTGVSEYGIWLPVTVRRFGRVSGATLVTVKLIADPARTYSRNLIFGPGATEKTVRFFIDDGVHTGPTAGTVELWEGDTRLESAPVQIYDDEREPVVWVESLTVRETDADQEARAILHVGPPPSNPVSVHLRTIRNTAVPPYDVVPLDRTFEIPAYAESIEIPLTIRGDDEPEGTEALWLEILSVTGAGYESWSKGWVFIADDDVPHLIVDRVVKSGSSIPVTVHFTAPAPVADSIQILPSDSTVVDVPRLVSFPAGAEGVTFPLTGLRGGEVSFTVSLPAFLDLATLGGRVIVDGMVPLVPAPRAIALAPGDETVIEAASGAIHGVATGNPAVVRAAIVFTEGKYVIHVYALAPGRTEIVISESPWDRERVVRVPVAVAEPAARKRSVGS